MPRRLKTIEDILFWIADHDATIKQLWKNQHKWNERIESDMRELDEKLSDTKEGVQSIKLNQKHILDKMDEVKETTRKQGWAFVGGVFTLAGVILAALIVVGGKGQ